MKKALCILSDTIKANGWDAKFVVNCHDEFQLECSPEVAELVGQAGVDSIRQAGEFYNLRCPLTGEYKLGKTWRDTH
jgi:DNA polymerase I-like protein with 3'-5' exonuclease and polymerase domains